MNASRWKDGFTGYLFVLFIAISLFVLLQEKNPGITSISSDEAFRLLNTDTAVVFLDVRTLEEWKSSSGHIKDAVFIPLQDLQNQLEDLRPFRERCIIVYCRSGNRSGKAAKLLSERGFNAVNLRGGIREWNAKKYPVYQENAP
jgi:phage shock protein E